jgi:hypothetical protein
MHDLLYIELLRYKQFLTSVTSHNMLFAQHNVIFLITIAFMAHPKRWAITKTSILVHTLVGVKEQSAA